MVGAQSLWLLHCVVLLQLRVDVAIIHLSGCWLSEQAACTCLLSLVSCPAYCWHADVQTCTKALLHSPQLQMVSWVFRLLSAPLG